MKSKMMKVVRTANAIRKSKVVYFALLCVGLQVGATIWLEVTDYLFGQASVAVAKVTDGAVRSIGYVKAEPEDDLTDNILYAERECIRYGLNPGLCVALLNVESSKQEDAISHKGARGLMQVMPANAARCGLKKWELFVPKKNISCGVKIFAEDMKATDGNVTHAIWRYNGGPVAVETLLKCGHNTVCMGGYKESYQHANKVLNKLAKRIA